VARLQKKARKGEYFEVDKSEAIGPFVIFTLLVIII